MEAVNHTNMTSNRKVVTAAEMQSIEQRWFDSGEITLEGMMDRVGKAIADWVLADLGPNAGDKNVLALVGKGNNGGDVLVAANTCSKRVCKRPLLWSLHALKTTHRWTSSSKLTETSLNFKARQQCGKYQTYATKAT